MSSKQKIDVPVLIEDGIRRMKFNPSLIEFLEKKVPFPKGKEFFYRLTEEERDVLGIVNGTSSAEGLLRASSMIPEIFWKSLYLLYCLDLIDFEGEEKAFVEERQVKKAATEEMESTLPEDVPHHKNGKNRRKNRTFGGRCLHHWFYHTGMLCCIKEGWGRGNQSYNFSSGLRSLILVLKKEKRREF